ncbi:MAG: LicD family protein [Oscillospiraceae bacterium]|nr:LicD family protein [Oscillospiraceae bacterium]
MREELISVIIPVYNVERYLVKCVESVMRQTHKNIQIILIDDGSTDLSSIICDELAQRDSRIEVVHQKNGGLCNARNTGLDMARGEYIAFIDSDDWATEDMFEYLLKGLKEHDADISACRYFRVIPGKETTARCDGRTKLFTADEAIEEIVVSFELRSVFWNKLFRNEIFDNIRFPNGKTFEGTYMMHEVFDKAKKIVMLGDAKYYYLKAPNSIVTSSNFKNDLNFAYSNLKRYKDLVGRFPHLIRKLVGDVILNISKINIHGYTITLNDIDAYREPLEEIAQFIRENEELIIKYFGEEDKEIKELRAFATLTIAGFKKAAKIRKHRLFIKKVDTAFRMGVKAFFKVNLKKKSKNQLPLIKKSRVGGSYYTGVDIDGDLKAQEKLAELHTCEVEIMREIERICREENIRYYMYGGTLLGAIRHKGFIPWDDDVDLVMSRAEYDRFAKACKKKLGKDYFYQTCFTDPEFPMPFAKVRKNNTRITEDKWLERNMHNGCFVDILPLDYFPKSEFLGKLYLQIYHTLHQACAFKRCQSSNPLAHIAFRYIKKRGHKYAYKLRDRFLRFVNAHGSKDYYCSFGSHYKPMIRRRLDSAWFGEPVYMDFEGESFPAPGHWQGYIHHLFGENYMELPPIEDRYCHSDFGRVVIDPKVYKKWQKYSKNAKKDG